MEKFPEEFPYLSSIQSLKGETPSEKYRELHRIASAIANNEEERVAFVGAGGVTERVKPALLPLMRILVADRLKLGNFVTEALKSDDVSVIKRALSASWFFDPANLDVDLITKEIVPNVSPQTRVYLVKALTKRMKKNNDALEKAEVLFERLANSYRVELVLPLLVACSEQFIYRVTVRRRIELPSRLLLYLYYGGRSRVVLKYLWLGVEKDPENELDRRAHTINLSNYVQFLPVLVKRHLREFLELYEYISSPNNRAPIKLGHTRAEFFLRNASKTLIENPKVFLPILPLKLVTRNLSREQFKSMYVNLFPDKWNMGPLDLMIGYLEFYPQHMKMQMFVRAYEQKYNIQFSLDIFEVYQWKALRDLLTWSEKEEWARFKLQNVKDKQEYYDRVYLLPPFKSIVELKERIRLISDSNSRTKCIKDMIKSCNFYDSKEGLTKVLEYYEARHKNEQYDMLSRILWTIHSYFDFGKLEQAQWSLLLNLASRAHTKDEIIKVDILIYIKLFQSAVNFYLNKLNSGCAEGEENAILNKQIGIILDLCLDKKCRWSPVVAVDEELRRDYLIRLLEIIPQKYPADHQVWNDNWKKTRIFSWLVREMNDINASRPPKGKEKNSRRKRRRSIQSDEKDRVEPPKITVKDYPWLRKFASDLISPETLPVKRKHLERTDKELLTALRLNDLEFYQSLMIDDDSTIVSDVESSNARLLFKRNPNEVLDKWRLYLDVCRQKLSENERGTQNFVRSCKWCPNLPLKFVEESLSSIEEPGSVAVLGLLLDGEAFSKIASRYHPSDNKTDMNVEDAKRLHHFHSSLIKAMNYSNPPVPLRTVLPFCIGDYLPLVTTIVMGLARRTPSTRIITFVGQLMEMSVSMKRLGIRLISQIASTTELKLFLENVHKTESNAGIRELTAKMIFEMFTSVPSLHTWELMKTLIESLSKDDDSIFQILTQINRVDSDFIAPYTQALLDKLESSLEKNEAVRFVRCLVHLLSRSSINLIPEETLAILVERVFPEAENFLIEVYAFSDPTRFLSRVSLLMKLLENETLKLNKPDSKFTRHYPANFVIRRFYQKVVNVLVKSTEKEISLRFVDRLLQSFSSKLEPHQDPKSYISLKILKDYFEAQNLEDFGRKLYQTCIKIITDFGTDYVISDIVEMLSTFVHNVSYCEGNMRDGLYVKLRITKIMVALDERIGSLIGLTLLEACEVPKYNDEYEQLVRIWQNSKDTTVKVAFHRFINTVGTYSEDE